MYIVAPHHVDVSHLVKVAEDMERLGPPTIRGAYDSITDTFFTIEGSHRIAAALSANIAIHLRDVPLGEIVEHDFKANPGYEHEQIRNPASVADIILLLQREKVSVTYCVHEAKQHGTNAVTGWRRFKSWICRVLT